MVLKAVLSCLHTREATMTSFQRRYIPGDGKPSTMTLEPFFWEAVAFIVHRQGIDLREFVRRCEAAGNGNRSSAVRVGVARYLHAELIACEAGR
jgi:predicted DNA-binding ribbon-helix-helix protein